MSYIRCLSNPECLYIWGESDGKVTIANGHNSVLRMPAITFHGLLKKWYKQEYDTPESDDDEFGTVTYKDALLTQTKDWKWALDYKGWERDIVLWEVTLVYICTQNRFSWAKR